MRNVYVIVLGFLVACGPEAQPSVPPSQAPLPVVLEAPQQSVPARFSNSVEERVPASHSLPVSVSMSCGQKLLAAVGRTGPEAQKLPLLYQKHSRRKDEQFLQYMFAVIYVESAFDRNARSDRDAYGLMQMTAIAVEDAVRYCKLKPVSIENMFDSVTNIRYGTCYLQKTVEELDGNWTQALILYNGGYRQLTRYQKGETITTETANYVLQVQRALELCSASNPVKEPL